MPNKPPTASCQPANPGKPRLRWPRKDRDAVDKLYHTQRWERFSRLIRDKNPICQVVEAGKQCREISKVVHHIKSPRQAPDLFLEPSNVVAICEAHHETSEGEDMANPHQYVPTNGMFGAVHTHEYLKPIEPGQVRILANGTAIVGK
jgi:hypothetical protein